jgi:3'-phosphoadenosine 5'-phosphosulfate sulfotransferase (PAPS reductase)/FAD synthetase
VTGSGLAHLDALESEAVHIFRKVAGEFEQPVILSVTVSWSGTRSGRSSRTSRGRRS